MPPILATKLYPPAPRANLVPRPRLMARLSEGFARKLTLVSAPAGFGKTTLLSEWRAGPGRDQPLAWLTVDEHDNDPVRFWSYVMAALETLSFKIDAAAITSLQSSQPQIEVAITALVNSLAQAPEHDCVLVLDDYHVIRSEAVHGSLAFMLEHMPSSVHLAILTRADPLLPLARLRVSDQLVELRAADLRCTHAETIAFFDHTLGLAISREALALLDTRTEGWLAGLQLIALSLKNRDAAQVDQFITDIAGTHHHILDYLTEEVLQNQPEDVRSFLLQTSILQQLNGALCETVTGQLNGHTMLTKLEHDNLFTEPLDATGVWYRYHRLFADVLYAHLQQTQPDAVPELHRRAKDWYARNGFMAEAMRHAIVARQFDWAAELIEQQQRAIVLRGELATLRSWLDALPIDLVRTRPRLSLTYAWASAYSGRYDAIEQHLRQAETAAQTLAPSEQVAVHGEALALRAVIQSVSGDAHHAVENAQAALAQVPEDDQFLRMVAWHALGNGYRRLGRPIEAEQALLQARSMAQPLNGVILNAAVELRLGQVHVMRGHLHQALRSFETTLQYDGQRGEALPNACEAYVRMGDIYREWNDLDAALQHVNKGIELAQRASNATALLSGYFTLMHIRFALGEAAAARETLHKAERYATRYDFAHLAERVAVHRAWLDLVNGDHTAAEAWSDDYLATRAAQRARAEFTTDLEDTLLARVLTRHGLAEAAQPILAEVHQQAEDAGRVYTALQTRALQALTLEAQHQHAQALHTLSEALALAEPEGYIRLFVDEGLEMQTLISELRFSIERQDDRRLAAYLRKLVEAFPASAPSLTPEIRNTKSKVQNLIEPLTARELEILRLLESGASNQQIADRLVIGVGTVKAHLNHIFGKLAAHNRVEAIAKARALGLLDEV